MIKALSLIIATSALTVSAWGADKTSTRVQKVSTCKKSSHSKGDHLIKECSKKLSFNEKIVLSGYYDKKIKEAIKGRMELLVLDNKGRNYYMGLGVRNSMFEPSGKIDILKSGASDKAIIYKLNYSEYDSQDSYFRIVTVRLRSNLIGARKTCIVAVSDSQDDNTKVGEKRNAKNLEKNYRLTATNFVNGPEFANAKCAEYVYAN